MDFFTSDTHFYHKNIIAYCKRPWNTMDDMLSGLISRWNKVVGPEDTVYHLGDVSFSGTEATHRIVSALNGRKILIRGNHDPKSMGKCANFGFDEVYDQLVLRRELTDKPTASPYDAIYLWLAHIPTDNGLDNRALKRPEPPAEYRIAQEIGYVSADLCGHVHSLWKYRSGCLNVGVDVWDWTPISLTQILDFLKIPQGEPIE